MTSHTIDSSHPSDSLVNVKHNGYLRLWRGVPRELGFLLLALPIATVGFGVSLSLLSAGIGTLVTFFIGVFFFAGMFYVSRGFGTLELIRLEWAGRPAITRPEWPREPGFWGWLRSLFGNGHYWLYSLHTALVSYIVSTVSWTMTVVWVSVGLGGVTQWFWDRFIPRGNLYPGYVSEWLANLAGGEANAAQVAMLNGRVVDHIIFAVLGIILIATLPLITHLFVLIHQGIARGMLSAFPSDGLRREVSSLSAARGAAISAEGQSLRRLERDIHDGPQQRLVRLQMDLASAQRQLREDPDAAGALIAQSRVLTHDALEELRALSRGIAPPILLDRGLLAALESLASRNTLPVTVTNTLEPGVEIPREIQRNAYFFASELVTNAAKHSEASAVTIVVSMRESAGGGDRWLELAVTDDGKGGAVAVDGHGLAGLDERLRGLGGTYELASPAGGPTVVTGRFPILS